MANIPMQTGFTRLFLQKYGASPANSVVYHNCMRFGAIDETFGDITKIECPHPTIADSFIEVGRIKSATERPTTQIVGHYPADEASTLKELASLGCDFDAYMLIGVCEDVSQFDNESNKLVVFDTSSITAYSTDDLGTLSSDGRAEVNETADISMKSWYEVLALSYVERAGDLVTNEAIDVVICDSPQCGDCGSNSDGCQKIFVLTLSAGGSPSTPADIVYSVDKGVNWYAVDIDTLQAAENPSALACVGDYVVVVANSTDSLHYALIDDFDTTPAVTWTEVSTGFVAAGSPNDIVSVGNTAFIVGDGGYVYKTTDPTSGVTVLDAGVAVTDNLNAVSAHEDDFFVAVGNSGAVVKSENGSTVSAVTPRPVGAGEHLNTIWVKENNNREWFIGTSAGNVYYTTDKGVNWTASTFSGSGSGVVREIAFATKHIGFLSHDTTTPLGRIFKTKNGGKTWVLQSTTLMPANDRFTALATCDYDPNFLVAVGLGDNASDGIIVVGED